MRNEFSEPSIPVRSDGLILQASNGTLIGKIIDINRDQTPGDDGWRLRITFQRVDKHDYSEISPRLVVRPEKPSEGDERGFLLRVNGDVGATKSHMRLIGLSKNFDVSKSVMQSSFAHGMDRTTSFLSVVLYWRV